MKIPPDPPDWQYDESTGLFVNFHDPEQVATYDELQNNDVREEERIVEALGLSADDTVIEYGAGTGAFVQAAARVCRYVYAVDVSEAMIDYARRRLVGAGLANVEFHQKGFLTYHHLAEPAGFVVTQFALHHLPDFWKVVALQRMNGVLQMGGVLFLKDVVFSFPPEFWEREVQRWIDEASGSKRSFSKADFEGHVRNEHSTYAWILEGIIRDAGFAVQKAEFRSSTIATYLCKKVRRVTKTSEG